jgi:nicotinate-nucleotide adenylyltransferase
MKRVGIFAGSFDPIHDGHLAIAQSAVDYLELDSIFFMVEKSPWSDKKPAQFEHRKKMVEIATKDFLNIGQLEISDERFDLNKTLPKIEILYPESELYFIFGADVFLRMNSEQWPNLEKLLNHCIAVFERDEITEQHITEHASSLGIVVANLPSKHLKHSSTDVRLQPNNSSLWVPEVVAVYISENGLYK